MLLQVPLPPVDERKKVVEDVDKDRRYAIDAAIDSWLDYFDTEKEKWFRLKTRLRR